MRQLPPLNALKAFEAVARLSSITDAAEELNVSRSSLSQHISHLEDYFGQKLFRRKGRGVEPTREALAYLAEARACLDRLAIASEQLSRRGKRRMLALNATPSFALRWLIPTSSDFQIKHPTIELRISTSASDAVDHLKEPFDFIFRRDRVDLPGYECRRILDDRSTPVLAPALLTQMRDMTPASLARVPLLHMKSRPNMWRDWFALRGVISNRTISGQLFDHFFLSFQAAVSGLGAAIGPHALLEEDLKEGRLVAPFPDVTIDGPGFHVIYREEDLNDRAIHAFLAWLASATNTELV